MFLLVIWIIPHTCKVYYFLKSTLFIHSLSLSICHKNLPTITQKSSHSTMNTLHRWNMNLSECLVRAFTVSISKFWESIWALKVSIIHCGQSSFKRSIRTPVCPCRYKKHIKNARGGMFDIINPKPTNGSPKAAYTLLRFREINNILYLYLYIFIYK